jgi:hypothetical protein
MYHHAQHLSTAASGVTPVESDAALINEEPEELIRYAALIILGDDGDVESHANVNFQKHTLIL